MIPGDPGGIHPKRTAAAETPIPLGFDLLIPGIPQRLWDLLHPLEVPPLYILNKGRTGGLERIRLYRGQTKEQSHLSSSHKNGLPVIIPQFYQQVNNHCYRAS